MKPRMKPKASLIALAVLALIAVPAQAASLSAKQNAYVACQKAAYAKRLVQGGGRERAFQGLTKTCQVEARRLNDDTKAQADWTLSHWAYPEVPDAE